MGGSAGEMIVEDHKDEKTKSVNKVKMWIIHNKISVKYAQKSTVLTKIEISVTLV